jgi:hypothetical protein
VTGSLLLVRPLRLHERGALPGASIAALAAAAGLAVWSVPLLLAAVMGLCRPTSLGLAGWAVALAGLAVMWCRRSSGSRRRAPGGEARRDSSRQDVLSSPLLLTGVVLAAALYLGFPTESIYGGRDEGVYANHAVYLAKHGRLDVPYPWAPEDSDVLSAWMGFPGFYKTPVTMTVQFGHLFSVWLAQAYATAGADGLFRLNAVFAVLSLGVFYGVCRLAVAAPYAVSATLFLAFNPSQLWMARITLSEVFTQLFAWAGLLLLGCALREGRAAAAHWAGAFVAAATLVRFDGLVLLPLLLFAQVAWALFRSAPSEGAEEPGSDAGTRVWWAFYQVAVPLSALAVGYYALASTPYFHDLMRLHLRRFAVATGVAAGVLLAARPAVLARLRPWLTSKVAFGVLAAIVVALSAYGYWLRPQPSAKPQWKFERVGYYLDVSRDYRQDSLVNLGKYLSPPVVGFAIGGWLSALWVRMRRTGGVHVLPVLVVVAGCSVVYLWNPAVYPDHFWGVRRFVPVVIPGAIFCAAIAAEGVVDRLPRRWGVAFGGVAALFLVAFTARAGRLIFVFAENQGLFEAFRHVAERLPAGEVIVTHGYKTWVTPLYVAFDRKVVPVDTRSAEGHALTEAWIGRQKARQQPAYLLVEVDASSTQPIKIDEFVLSRRFIEPTVQPLPTRIQTMQTRLELYRVPP